MTNLAFEDDDRRQFPQNDMLLGPCPLLAAMYADQCLDEAWNWGENASYEASLTYWRKHVRMSIDTGTQICWELCVKYLSPRKDKHGRAS